MNSQIKTVIQKPLALFVRTTCPFCINANKLALQQGVKPEVVELDRISEGDTIRGELADMTRQKTVPYVFSKGEFIGGFSELRQKNQAFWDALKK